MKKPGAAGSANIRSNGGAENGPEKVSGDHGRERVRDFVISRIAAELAR